MGLRLYTKDRNSKLAPLFSLLVFMVWGLSLVTSMGIECVDWDKKDYDEWGSRNSPETGFNENISLKWAFFATNQVPIYATPLVFDGAVLIVLQNGIIYLLREDNGAVIWQKNIF
ncbi:MAG: hypothetical protein ACK4NF_03635 [Planctomycetota bacterium]